MASACAQCSLLPSIAQLPSVVWAQLSNVDSCHDHSDIFRMGCRLSRVNSPLFFLTRTANINKIYKSARTIIRRRWRRETQINKCCLANSASIFLLSFSLSFRFANESNFIIIFFFNILREITVSHSENRCMPNIRTNEITWIKMFEIVEQNSSFSRTVVRLLIKTTSGRVQTKTD